MVHPARLASQAAQQPGAAAEVGEGVKAYYVGLLDESGAEPEDPAYERQLVRFDEEKGYNIESARFKASEDWNEIVAFALFEEPAGGLPAFAVIFLSRPTTVKKGDPVTGYIGAIVPEWEK